MPTYLQDKFEDTVIGVQSSIHDCRNTADIAGETEVIIASGNSIDFYCDKLEYEFKNLAFNTWDSVNKLFDTTNYVENATLVLIVGGEMKAGTANAILLAELVIPATSEIVVDQKAFGIPDVGVYHKDRMIFHPYVGAAAKADNFMVRLSASGGDITIKNTFASSRI